MGLTTFLAIFFRDQYGIEPFRAGMYATTCSLVGSLLRPLGGALADRFGGLPILFLVYIGVGVLGLRLSYVPHFEVTLASLVLLLGLMGIGNGAVFEMIPRRFQINLGMATGIVGMAGGLGGSVLALLMSLASDRLGHFGPAFFAVGTMGLLAAGMLLQISRRWHTHHAAPASSMPISVPASMPNAGPIPVSTPIQVVHEAEVMAR